MIRGQHVMLRLTGRYYRTIPIDKTGCETEAVELDPERTAFIGMHCWNIGCEDGPEIDPDFCVGMGYYETFREAERIMRECIRPAMDAAREAGILVCHVESPTIGEKHPDAQKDIDAPAEQSKPPPSVVSGWREQIIARSHGKDYATRSHEIASSSTMCSPRNDVILAVQKISTGAARRKDKRVKESKGKTVITACETAPLETRKSSTEWTGGTDSGT